MNRSNSSDETVEVSPQISEEKSPPGNVQGGVHRLDRLIADYRRRSKEANQKDHTLSSRELGVNTVRKCMEEQRK